MWAAQLDRPGGTQALAQAMINFYAPGVPDEALVAHLWGTIIETAIPLDALSAYVGLVANGTFTQASLLDFVSTYDLNTAEIVGLGGALSLSLDLRAAGLDHLLVLAQLGLYESRELLRRGRRGLGHQRRQSGLQLGAGQRVDKRLVQSCRHFRR